MEFRPIVPADIPLLHRWRNLPHVSAWWQPPKPSLALATEEYSAYLRDDFPVQAYLVLDGLLPFGYIQRWLVKDFPEYQPFVKLHPWTAGIDVLIGDPEYLHKGWGTRLMREFLRAYVFDNPQIPACLVDPLPHNAAAIRSYEKVGFQHATTFMLDGKGVYLMLLQRDAFMPVSP